MKSGDVIKIGEYKMDIVLEQMKKESIPVFDDQKTMFFSNPFDKVITWSNIQTANGGLTQPIHFYQTGSYTNPKTLNSLKDITSLTAVV